MCNYLTWVVVNLISSLCLHTHEKYASNKLLSWVADLGSSVGFALFLNRTESMRQCSVSSSQSERRWKPRLQRTHVLLWWNHLSKGRYDWLWINVHFFFNPGRDGLFLSNLFWQSLKLIFQERSWSAQGGNQCLTVFYHCVHL